MFLYFHIAVRSLLSRITYKTKARSASAVPTGAAPPLLLTVGEPPETPFSKSNKSRRGKFQKICKGFSGGARAGLPAQAARLRFSILC